MKHVIIILKKFCTLEHFGFQRFKFRDVQIAKVYENILNALKCEICLVPSITYSVLLLIDIF
jgi:hypothetical protein